MYIAIAGNIGSGKTTLTEMLTRRYRAKCYLEESNNPYIGDFYEDMNRWSFQLQISFLGSRIEQTMDMLASGDEDIIQDRTIHDAHPQARPADLPQGERSDAHLADSQAGPRVRDEHRRVLPAAAQREVRPLD